MKIKPQTLALAALPLSLSAMFSRLRAAWMRVLQFNDGKRER